jgi:spermidine/putrescine ABC transporter ATP-binding subunit
MIQLQNICKSFGRVQAVQNVSLDVAQGEFFSLLGASGSGKTTLLRMIAGFEPVTSGRIVIDGQPMQDVPPHLRPVNMVFQNYALFPHLNVRDNIACGLRSRSVPQAQRQDMVDAMLDLIALPGYGDRRPSQLSGGQMQRVALARALILKPKVLLLDEPLGALDKQLREQMQLELRALQQTLGITFVLVTHDQDEALALSDRIAVMATGQVLQTDTPAVLYENPSSRAVASFVGTMNFFAGNVAASSAATTTINAEGLGQVAVGAAASRHPLGAAVVLAVRPENLTLSLELPINTKNFVAGTVQTTAYLGERRQFRVQLNGKVHPVVISAQNERRSLPQDIEQGRAVWLSWTDDAFVVFEHE